VFKVSAALFEILDCKYQHIENFGLTDLSRLANWAINALFQLQQCIDGRLLGGTEKVSNQY